MKKMNGSNQWESAMQDKKTPLSAVDHGDAAGWHHKVIGVKQLHIKCAIAFQLSHLHMICSLKQHVNTATTALHHLYYNASDWMTASCTARLLISITLGYKWPRRRSNTPKVLQRTGHRACFSACLFINQPPAKESDICQQRCYAAHAFIQPAGMKI